MKVYTSIVELEGAPLEGENPLPMFASRNPHREVIEDGSFTPELKTGFGDDTGERYLPYRMQDRYTRRRRPMALKTIVLENELLQAVFLPEYGGRLYALKDRRTGRDVLYRNPAFQPANLAILNAWFSGGIEWNIGQVGHTFGTCSPIHTARMRDRDGHEFVRMYDYERCRNVFWQIDFHLPPGAKELQIYVRIINDNERSVPMYWWTNIAVEETERCRVFAATGKAIYISPELSGHGVGELPSLPSLPGGDASYPLEFPFSSEYFFLTPEECRSPWEAVAYEDGRLFYERSTARLRYRKMFCWGHHAGGQRWRDFLAKPGEGGYVEVQGGFAPTQLHGLKMPGNSVWDFTQLIGMDQVDPEKAQAADWHEAQATVERTVDALLNEEQVYAIHERLRGHADQEAGEPLHAGSGWGALERLRRSEREGRSVPEGLSFPDGTLGEPQHAWLALLREGRMPETAAWDVPASWMVQDEWRELLETSLRTEDGRGRNWTAYLHYGVMLLEVGKEEEAKAAWETSLRLRPSAWAYRNLARLAVRQEDEERAAACYEQAYLLSNGFPDRAFAEEYLQLLVRRGEYERAWRLYESLPDELAGGDRIRIVVGAAALELGQDEYMQRLFETEFAIIREGEVLIIDLWYKYHATKLAQERGTELSDALLTEAKAKFPPPGPIDFRMIGG
ncbi:DUF5107 domain-containing protein [Cohnella phaseoli]|uniref:Uncharacterized protein DUF5107 n=1 Tax=Cohnella phaseoli TaxID=456490 RepID=A0A3D9JPS3_9BACL|nr:DUF5107 domain-containing protein [Cohnella phaseoli]RED75799.1 uncharacterized protein DUF5107 [Cohnella phaseoli]